MASPWFCRAAEASCERNWQCRPPRHLNQHGFLNGSRQVAHGYPPPSEPDRSEPIPFFKPDPRNAFCAGGNTGSSARSRGEIMDLATRPPLSGDFDQWPDMV